MPDDHRLLDLIDRFSRTSVALIGDLVLDRFILGTPKRISREAPVIILRHEGQRDVPGGAAGARAVGITTGVFSAEALREAGANRVIARLDELLELL